MRDCEELPRTDDLCQPVDTRALSSIRVDMKEQSVGHRRWNNSRLIRAYCPRTTFGSRIQIRPRRCGNAEESVPDRALVSLRDQRAALACLRGLRRRLRHAEKGIHCPLRCRRETPDRPPWGRQDRRTLAGTKARLRACTVWRDGYRVGRPASQSARRTQGTMNSSAPHTRPFLACTRYLVPKARPMSACLLKH